MKFKGHTLKANQTDYVLRDQLSEGGFSLIYTTNRHEVICKVQTISQASIAQAYWKEKYATLMQEFPHHTQAQQYC
jgi:hypothetical protein